MGAASDCALSLVVRHWKVMSFSEFEFLIYTLGMGYLLYFLPGWFQESHWIVDVTD